MGLVSTCSPSLSNDPVNGRLIVTCLRLNRCIARSGNIWNRDSRNDGDNRDDNEKLNQAERRVDL